MLAGLICVAIGSIAGGTARYFVSGLVARRFGETFPWGTLIVNVVGSIVIGFFFTITGSDGRWLVSSTARQFVMVGLCGGYTTFSSFSLQTLMLARDSNWRRACLNITLSVVLCLAAAAAGFGAAATLLMRVAP